MDESTATLTLVRTKCCGGYKQFGQRCSICPNRPENREALMKYKHESLRGLGCNPGCSQYCATDSTRHSSAL